VALVVPLQGPAGVFGPSCELCARLAAEEVNADGGVLGRELRFVVVDGARQPTEVAERIDRLLTARAVEAITGWHISAVRNAVAPRIAGRAPYVYTPLYEGGEHRPGVFLTGETPTARCCPPCAGCASSAVRGAGPSWATTMSGPGKPPTPLAATPRAWAR
jgi:ABC-type branched-subunit amino acid transport system substrate-binding protein